MSNLIHVREFLLEVQTLLNTKRCQVWITNVPRSFKLEVMLGLENGRWLAAVFGNIGLHSSLAHDEQNER
jgi:hypothetical protein